MTGSAATELGAAQRRPAERWWRLARRLPWLPIVLLAPVVVCGLFGPWLYPHDPTTINFIMVRKPPAWLDGGNWSYLLGTDQFGRDLLSRLIEGARVALIVAIMGVLGAAVIGIPAGMAAGYFGGWIDNIIMRLVDVKMSIPAILLTILIGAAIGGGLVTIVASIALVFWADYARVVRGEALVIREQGYVALARVANCSNFRILTRHVFPNLLATCVVLITLQLGRALIIEASITFIGLGIQPPDSAWGLLIAEGRAYLATAWWIPTFAGLAITITVLGANLLGDWLRDVLDPRQRQL
jgi:peptide/nickel transport system permease protein